MLLNSSLEFRTVVEAALESTERLFSAQGSAVFLLDNESGSLSFFALTGAKKGVLKGFKIPSQLGIVGWVVEHGQPRFVPDTTEEPLLYRNVDERTGLVTRCLVCLPLITKGRMLGALEILNWPPGGLDWEKDRPFLETFANQIATALDNALLYEELSVAHESLRELDEMKSDFIAVASHELRTPATLIKSFHQVLASGQAGEVTATQRQILEKMAKGIAWLNRVVESVTSIASLDNRPDQNQPAMRLDLVKIAQRLVSELGLLFERRQQIVTLDFASSPMEVVGNETQIEQVLRNILINAIRFTRDGGRIGVTILPHEREVEVAVCDTGIGIPRQEQERIFERFYEVAPASQHTSGTVSFLSGGLGLGLAIARRIIELHGGRIWVDSEVGVGSTFSFTVPRPLEQT
ncbi:MAG: GAF domain-containing sensor histidine kinase [Candidatus Schekmanbacteria bacterium]|nr:GAF domain-containing sensor histidine kinase [Candidatus Schekmanbacteria bacterium]